MVNKYFYNLSVTIVGVVVLIFILTTVGGLFHIPVNPFFVLLPFIGGIYYLRIQSTENIDFLKQFLILLLIIMVSCTLAVFIWDTSSDGRWYHSATLVMLKNGWLPVYHKFMEFAANCHVHPESAFWGNFYLRFVETVGANIYKITNLIESAKAVNLIALSAVFMYSYSVLKEFKPQNKFMPLITSFIIVLNPVSICQWFTNFIDLHIYFAFTLLVLTIIKIELQQKTVKTDLFMFVSSALMLAMTKLTGCMYLFIICLLYFLYLFPLKRDVKKYIKTILIIGGLIALTGVSPFYTTFKNRGNPFFPVWGKNRLVIINNIPVGFETMSNIERFLRSTFSESVMSMNSTDIQEFKKAVKLKIPFTMHKKSPEEAVYIPNPYEFCFPDMRVGGLGFFWSGILLLSLFYLPFIRFRNKNEKYLFWLLTAMILTTTFSNPHSWWARFIPQFWLFSVFILFFGLLQENYKNNYSKKIKLSCLYFIMLAFIVNSSIILFQNIYFKFLLSKLIQRPYNYIDSIIKPQDKILLMVKPAENMKSIDETIIPHLEEYYGKKNIIYVSYDESKISSEEFLPIQCAYVLNTPFYFFKIEQRK